MSEQGTTTGVADDARAARAEEEDGGRPTIVMVHGAFADGSSWSPVIQRLQDAGHRVVAVANPLRGLAADAAHVRSVLDTIAGPVVLVGHSYGGAVITEAGAAAPGVKALVYIAAFMPDAGEVLGELAAKYPGSALEGALAPAQDGSGGLDLYLRADSFRAVVAADVPESTTRLLAAVQRPLAVSAFSDRASVAAWRTIPSWTLVATEDRGIVPELQRFQAQRAGSRTVEVPSSHLPLYSRPEAVASLIQAAARSITA
ncbi:alpha/beta fold hydrolase [Streptomyces inhibens]|uniref:alpha/beta fold hydrolase n=1 Tax=Streptomyces inhibens TaxID=2293571 RepID=UPI003695CFE1